MRPRTGGRTGTELILVGIGRRSPRSSGTRLYPGHQLLERQVARTDPVCGIARRLAQPRRPQCVGGSREMQTLLNGAAAYVNALGPREIVWIGIGFLGQFLFRPARNSVDRNWLPRPIPVHDALPLAMDPERAPAAQHYPDRLLVF